MQTTSVRCRVCGKISLYSTDALLSSLQRESEIRVYCPECFPSRDISGLDNASTPSGADALARCGTLWDFMIKNFPQACQEAEKLDPTADAVDAAIGVLSTYQNTFGPKAEEKPSVEEKTQR